jgi:hypothetical protein
MKFLKKLKQFNIYTEFVGLITTRTRTGTAITAHSINTLFIWPAGRVRAFIYFHTSIVCLIIYFSDSAIISLTPAVIQMIVMRANDWITFERALIIPALKSWTTVMGI